jgi:uncharacterized peroxidase-related enzyme
MRHHGAGLRRLLHDEAKAQAIETDHAAAPLSPRERAMLDYAAKLTRTPDAMTRADIEALRRAGLGDAEILDVCQVTGYFAFVNRLADGLGVELEDHWDEPKTGDTRPEKRVP